MTKTHTQLPARRSDHPSRVVTFGTLFTIAWLLGSVPPLDVAPARADDQASEQRVSFADEIAPIFHARCVACHNARNAQGRYNMSTFQSLFAEGDSGVEIEPGQAVDSHLVDLIEEGSMPYDADPLSEQEIQSIRRWIDQGARLDEGADPAAPLIRLIPRMVQPDPPPHYRVPMPVTALAIDPDGERLASSGYHEVLLWSLANGELQSRLTNVAERVYGLAFHPDGERIAVASGTPGRLGEVKVFSVASGELVNDLLVSQDAIFCVEFSPDGSRLAAGAADGMLAIFPMDDSDASSRMIQDHSDWVHSVAWSPDGKRLVTSSRDKTAKVFDAESGELLLTFGGHDQSVTDAAFLSDGTQAVSCGADGKLRVWNIADGEQKREVAGAGRELSGIEVLSEDRLLPIGRRSLIRIHGADDGKSLMECELPTEGILSLALSADERTACFGTRDGRVHRVRLDDEVTVEQSWPAMPSG